MQEFRVFGRKYQDYYTKVNAENAYEAMEIANKQDTIKWFQLPDDDTIEAVDVFLEDNDKEDLVAAPLSDIELIDSNEDEWPDMNTGILTGL
jgi:hypothetical protein